MFHRVKIWITNHPYIAGGGVLLIVLYFVLRGRSSGSATVAAGGQNPQVALANLQAQTQQQAIQAQTDTANNQIGAMLAAKQLDVQATVTVADNQRDIALASIAAQAGATNFQNAAQLQAAQGQYGAQVQIAGLQTGAAIQIADIQAGRDLGIAGIQAPIQLAAIQAALDQQKDIDLASMTNVKTNAYRDITINAQNTDTALAITKDTNATQLAGLVNTNNTALGVIQAQEGTKQLGITTLGNLNMADIFANFQLSSQHEADVTQIQQYNDQQYWKSIFADDRWGSGSNQVAALAALTNQPAIGVTANQTQATSAMASASMWSSIMNGIFGVAKTALVA